MTAQTSHSGENRRTHSLSLARAHPVPRHQRAAAITTAAHRPIQARRLWEGRMEGQTARGASLCGLTENNVLQAGFYSSCLGYPALSEQLGMAWCHGHPQSLGPDPTSLGSYKSMGFPRWEIIVGGLHTVKERSTAKFILSLPRLQGLQTWQLAKGCFGGRGRSKFLVGSSNENSHGRLTSHSISRTSSRPVIQHISVFIAKVTPWTLLSGKTGFIPDTCSSRRLDPGLQAMEFSRSLQPGQGGYEESLVSCVGKQGKELDQTAKVGIVSISWLSLILC